MTTRAWVGSSDAAILGFEPCESENYDNKISQITNFYFATMICQPQAAQAPASALSGMRSTITPAHLSMFGTRNDVRRPNLVWSANRYARPLRTILPRVSAATTE